jgi:hypothetical protein
MSSSKGRYSQNVRKEWDHLKVIILKNYEAIDTEFYMKEF